MATNHQSLDTRGVSSKTKLLLNRNLINILKDERLPHTGVKAAMQARIINQIEEYARRRDVAAFNRLRNNIYNPDQFSFPGSKLGPNSPSSPLSPGASSMAKGFTRPYVSASGSSGPSYTSISGHIDFKESPFQTVLESVTPVQTCPAMNSHRHTVSTALRLQRPTIDKLKGDSSMRLMVYCGAEAGFGAFSKTDIAFPHQVELKVNQDDVKANLRGLKNKPGSTRPADITDAIHKVERYENTLAITYALTTKKFFFVVKLVKAHPVPELVTRLRLGRVISKESVIREMVAKSQDTDIIATSAVMSLKCPLSTLRMDLPCRSTICSHIQCFDGTSFLQLQQQAPTWTCPICNKTISFEALAVDEYVDDILHTTARSVEQVTIEPDGKWSLSSKASTSHAPLSNGKDPYDDDDDDDDIVEIPDMRVKALKSEAGAAPNWTFQTPAASSREDSSSLTPSSRPLSGKRPIAQVIDLTLSSDDEDGPPRAAKRQNTSRGPRYDSEAPNEPRPFASMPGRWTGMGFGYPRESSNGTGSNYGWG